MIGLLKLLLLLSLVQVCFNTIAILFLTVSE
eukprot:SAG31_NODE_3990_length_3681_cov_2.353992_3_plen_31_part_00